MTLNTVPHTLNFSLGAQKPDNSTGTVGTVSFTGFPADAQTVILDDGFKPITFEFDAVVLATGQVVFTDLVLPADGDLITLVDAKGNSVTFEMDSGGGVAPGNTAVTIGATNDACAVNLRAAIVASILRMAAVGALGDVDLTQDDHGTAGNTNIIETGTNITHTDFTGGDEPVAAGSNYPVAIAAIDGDQDSLS